MTMKSANFHSGSTLLFVTSLLFLEIPVVDSAIQCFSCTNGVDRYPNGPPCGDHFRLLSVDASDCAGTCIKTRGERWAGSTRSVELNRYCGEMRKDGCYSDYYNDISVKACACNTDFCNSASLNTMSAITLNVCYVVSLCFLYRYM